MKEYIKKLFWILLAIGVIVGASYLLRVYRNNLPIPDNAVALEFPLKNGSFVIMNSGKSYDIHTSTVEKYALDITKQGNSLNIFKSMTSSLEDDPIYGESVYSPCVGNVKDTNDGVKDQPFGVRDRNAGGGNSITIGCDGFDVYMAHFKSGTLLVKEGEIVSMGQEIAKVGNSGNTTGPHLHLMAYKWNEDNTEKIPLPLMFNGRYLYRWDIFKN